MDACLGDTVILPFVLNDYRGHTFSFAYRSPAGPPPGSAPLPEGLVPATDSVANPAAAHLRYLGTHAYVMQHRALGGTVVHSATFEARAPGRFNLGVTVREPGVPPGPASPSGSVPVIVVPRGQPVTVLLANESVTSVDSLHRFSSHTGSQYLTTHLLLQPGDRVSFEYSRATTRGRGSAALREIRRSGTQEIHSMSVRTTRHRPASFRASSTMFPVPQSPPHPRLTYTTAWLRVALKPTLLKSTRPFAPGKRR
jgi:hypothetical protein